MAKSKKLTLEDLITRKTQSENDKLKIKEIYVQNLDGNIVLQKSSIAKVIDLMDNIENADSIKEGYEFQKQLIYMHCPVMHDKQLQDIYECAEPYDIIDKLFGDNVGDVSKAAEEVLNFYGLADEVDKIKNL